MDSAGLVTWVLEKIGLEMRIRDADTALHMRPGDLVSRGLRISVIPPSPPCTWWTCGVCGRRSAWTPGTLPGWGEINEFYKPSFWYDLDGVLHCKDCGWRCTDRFKKTGEPPLGGWYPPCDGKPVLEFSLSDVHRRRYEIYEMQ